jgi:hypothetical protein
VFLRVDETRERSDGVRLCVLAHGPDERYPDEQQLAEVEEARQRTWVANAPLRAPYELENIGATKAQAATGELRFDSSQPQ